MKRSGAPAWHERSCSASPPAHRRWCDAEGMGAAGDEAASDGGGGIAFFLGDFLDALDGFGFEEGAIAESAGDGGVRDAGGGGDVFDGYLTQTCPL
jgi:hypothetical protein